LPDALPTTTLPIYPGLGQAQNMLACIPHGLVLAYPIAWKDNEKKTKKSISSVASTERHSGYTEAAWGFGSG